MSKKKSELTYLAIPFVQVVNARVVVGTRHNGHKDPIDRGAVHQGVFEAVDVSSACSICGLSVSYNYH